MASSAKDIQLRELKDTVSQRKTMIAEQTELIKALRLIIDEKTSHEKALQEAVWGADQPDDPCKLDHLLFKELFSANVRLLSSGAAET